MINKSRNIATDACINRPSPVQLKTPDVPLLEVTDLTLSTFLSVNLFSCIIDNAFVLIDRLARIHTPTVNLRFSFLEHFVMFRNNLPTHSAFTRTTKPHKLPCYSNTRNDSIATTSLNILVRVNKIKTTCASGLAYPNDIGSSLVIHILQTDMTSARVTQTSSTATNHETLTAKLLYENTTHR